MKVLMVIDRYFPIWGGAENQLRQLSKRLLDLGCKVTVVTRRWTLDMPVHDYADSIPVIRLGWPGTGPIATFGYTISLLCYLLYKGRTVNLIHTHGAAALGALGSLAARLTRSRNVAKIATAGRIPALQKKTFGTLILSWLKRSDAIVSMTDEIRHELNAIKTSSRRIVCIPNAVDANRFRRLSKERRRAWRVKRGFGPEDIVVIFSGRFVRRKGLDILLDAWPQVVTCYPKTRLIILGTGHNQLDSIEEQMRNKVIKEGIPNAYFEGETNIPESYLSVGDIFVFPSRKEGFPNALLEAMASGLATIASQIGGVTDVIKSAAMGLTFTDGDAHALAKAIIYLEGKPMERASVGRFAREYVLNNYPFSNIAKQYLDLYQSLMT